MEKYRKICCAVALFASVVFSSCTTTRITSSWVTNNPPAYMLDKMLVVSVMTDREVMDRTEHEMVAQLKEHNVNAVSSLDLFGPKRFKGLTEEQVVEKLQDSGYTAVMLVSLLDKEKETRYVPGTVYYQPYYPAYYPGYMHFYNRYSAIYGNIYTPGYYTTTTKYILEADIYVLNDDYDALIYSAQTRTDDPSSAQNLARTFSKSIVDELHQKGLVR